MQLYEDRFSEIKAAQSIAKIDDDNVINAAMHTTVHALPDVSLSDLSRQINDQDVFVSRKTQFGIFPVSDFKYFPARKPDALGWQVGLRSYFRHNERQSLTNNGNENPAPSEPLSNNTVEVGRKLVLQLPVIASTQSSISDEKMIRQWHQASDAASRLTRQSSTTMVLMEQMKSQYSIEELPAPCPEVAAKYFDQTAKDNFYATYAQLRRRGEILKGGYEEQRQSLLQSEGSDVMEASVTLLQEYGVISPRQEQFPNLQHIDSFSASMSSMSVERDEDQQGCKSRVHNVFQEDDQPGGSAVEREEQIPALFSDSLGSLLPRLDLSDRSYVDSSLDRHHGAASPRAIFLNGCLANNIPPITTALIRKKLSSTINLSHMGLGNQLALILAPCISAMPYLQVLNLTDNNLQDSGLAALIVSIARHPDVQILDISQNVIGSEAADALASFIGEFDCDPTDIEA